MLCVCFPAESGARVSSEVQCPVCTLTLRPASVEQHFKQELERARDPYKLVLYRPLRGGKGSLRCVCVCVCVFF